VVEGYQAASPRGGEISLDGKRTGTQGCWGVAVSPPDSSPYLLWGGAGLLLIFLVWRGWRLGVARQAMELAGVLSAYVAGYLFGPVLAPMLWSLGFPEPVLNVLARVIAGFVVYLGFVIFAAVFLKKTAQQSFGPLRFTFGVGGALLALATGVIFVGALLVSIRFYGTLAEPRAELDRATVAARKLAPAPEWLGRIVKMKQALEGGFLGELFRRADPVPPKIYDDTKKIGEVLANPQAMDRFLSFKNVRPLAEHPKIVALRDDPTIQKAAQAGNYTALLKNPRLVQAMNDPEIARLLKGVEFEKALDYALGPGERGR
jgi:hypothetical protein